MVVFFFFFFFFTRGARLRVALPRQTADRCRHRPLEVNSVERALRDSRRIARSVHSERLQVLATIPGILQFRISVRATTPIQHWKDYKKRREKNQDSKQPKVEAEAGEDKQQSRERDKREVKHRRAHQPMLIDALLKDLSTYRDSVRTLPFASVTGSPHRPSPQLPRVQRSSRRAARRPPCQK